MATQQKNFASSSAARPSDLKRCKQDLRFLLGHLSRTMPAQQAAFQSVLLLHFQEAAMTSIPNKQLKGVSRHGRR